MKNLPVRRTKETMSNVDAYYADILNIPAHRDAREGNFTTTRQQILRVQNPVQGLVEDPNVYMDPFFNNSPYLRTYDSSGARRRGPDGTLSVTDSTAASEGVPDATYLDLWAGEMRALSNKEMTEGLSSDEEELLRAYQEYFTNRTGMQDGGVVLPDEQKGIFGLLTDTLFITEPPEGAPIGSSRQAAIRDSSSTEYANRADFYEPGAANFGERLMLEYGYPGEYDPETNREIFDMAVGGRQATVLPPDRLDLPEPQELRDARQHLLGSALAARGYGEGIAGFMGNVNERVFGYGQAPADRAMDERNNAVGLDLFRQAGIEATTQQLTQMVDDAIFAQLDQIMARAPGQRNFRSPETGPDLYFPRDARGRIATQN
jgi:hypothetical protein